MSTGTFPIVDSIAAQLDALRSSAGTCPLHSGWITVRGDDRVRWLNGMVTNSVQALTPGDGAYSFMLSAQGRIQGDATIWAEPGQLLMQTATEQVQPLTTLLNRFIIMDDVVLEDMPAQHGLLVAGPRAAELLTSVGIVAKNSRLLKRTLVQRGADSLALLHAYSPLVPRFELWTHDADALNSIATALQHAGAAVCTQPAIELLRMLEGTPLYGVDLHDRDLPQETAQTRALHFNKGCYLGQEIVERIRSRGNVHRTFTAFTLTGDVPAPGTALHADDKAVGELTSIATEPIDNQRLAHGFVRREAVERAHTLTYVGGVAEPRTAATAS